MLVGVPTGQTTSVGMPAPWHHITNWGGRRRSSEWGSIPLWVSGHQNTKCAVVAQADWAFLPCSRVRQTLLRNGRADDSSREFGVVAGLHERTHPAELQDQEPAGPQRSAEAAWLPDYLVRPGDGVGAAADRQSAAVWRCRDPDMPDNDGALRHDRHRCAIGSSTMSTRQTTGFVESLLRLVGLAWTVPDFSTLIERGGRADAGRALPLRRKTGAEARRRGDPGADHGQLRGLSCLWLQTCRCRAAPSGPGDELPESPPDHGRERPEPQATATRRGHDAPMLPHIARGSEVHGRDQLWMSGITYVAIATGFVYLAVLLDAWSRRVVGYALDRKIDAPPTPEGDRLPASNARLRVPFGSRFTTCIRAAPGVARRRRLLRIDEPRR